MILESQHRSGQDGAILAAFSSQADRTSMKMQQGKFVLFFDVLEFAALQPLPRYRADIAAVALNVRAQPSTGAPIID